MSIAPAVMISPFYLSGEMQMESNEIAYLLMVVAAFGLFMLSLAWSAHRR
ncbi:hypothetical protein [Desertibaculum subflavum]